MRVVFLEDVEGVAQGGDVKEVKNGFARNYLIPKNLAVPATHNALQKVQGLTVQAEKDRVKMLSDMTELATYLEGVQVNVEMRAGATGQLYGSVTNSMVAEKLLELTEREIDRRVIEISDPIRDLGRFEVNVRLHADVHATIAVLVYPLGKDPEEYAQLLVEEAEAAAAREAAGVDGFEYEVVAEDFEDAPEASAAEDDSESESEPADSDEPEEEAAAEESAEEDKGDSAEAAEETDSEDN